ncbi:MAG: hypothetical protein QOD77_1299 [Thermoplasmata archaeon]|jgi:hypothetical protein|nr:hypothetical protein [Thermoplasmata archaeon]
MKPTAFGLLALLLLSLLSGCSGDDAGASDTTTSGTSPTTTGPPAANKAPTLTFTGSTAGGNVPLLVNFTLDARDPEGKPLTWTVETGDGAAAKTGSTLPATFSHTFASAGNFTVRATVSDGDKQANRTFPVKALPQGVVGPSQSASVSWDNGVYGCGDPYDAMIPGSPAAGVLYAELAIDQATIALPFTADFGDLDGALFVAIDFYDADGMRVEGGDFVSTSPAIVTGDVPEGAAYAHFVDCGTAGHAATYLAA